MPYTVTHPGVSDPTNYISVEVTNGGDEYAHHGSPTVLEVTYPEHLCERFDIQPPITDQTALLAAVQHVATIAVTGAFINKHSAEG